MLIEKYKIPVITDIKDLKTLKNITFYKRTRDFVNKHVLNNIGRKGDTMAELIKVGDKIMSNTYHRISKQCVLHKNYEFIVKDITKDNVTIANICNEDSLIVISHKLLNEKFSYAYAINIDCIQGTTISEDTTLFDLQNPYMDFKYMYTILSRFRSLKYVTIFEYSKEQIKKLDFCYEMRRINTNIENHKMVDRLNNREFDEKEYVDFSWVLEKLKEQQYRSAWGEECILTLETLSIDRVCNDIAHTKENCQLLSIMQNRCKSDS
jgi:hypothetical protein